MDHGLVFPFAQPFLEDPYEPRISEVEECLATARAFLARRSGGGGESSSVDGGVTPAASTVEGNEESRNDVGGGGSGGRFVIGRNANARHSDGDVDADRSRRSELRLQGIVLPNPFPLRLSTSRAYD